MRIKIILVILSTFFLLSGCQTVKQKTDSIVEKENEKLSEFIGESASKLQMELGKPDEDFKNAKGNFELLQGGGYDPGDDEPVGFYGEIDNRCLAKQAQDFLFSTLGVGEATAKAISAFAKAAQLGGGKKAQAQGQGRGRIGPGLTTSTPRTSAAGRTSRARQATSGERAVQ